MRPVVDRRHPIRSFRTGRTDACHGPLPAGSLSLISNVKKGSPPTLGPSVSSVLVSNEWNGGEVTSLAVAALSPSLRYDLDLVPIPMADRLRFIPSSGATTLTDALPPSSLLLSLSHHVPQTATALTFAACSGLAAAYVAPTGFAGSRVAAQTRSSASLMRMDASGLIGADVETGGVFDPAGLSKKSDADLYKFRCAELKHGRVAMLAVLGFIATGAGFHLPDPVFSGTKPLDVLSGLAESRPLALIQIVAAITWIELVAGKQDPSKDPGDVGSFGDNFKPADPEEYAALQLKELKNGRLAMLASMGLIVQELITGENIVDQLSKGIF